MPCQLPLCTVTASLVTCVPKGFTCFFAVAKLTYFIYKLTVLTHCSAGSRQALIATLKGCHVEPERKLQMSHTKYVPQIPSKLVKQPPDKFTLLPFISITTTSLHNFSRRCNDKNGTTAATTDDDDNHPSMQSQSKSLPLFLLRKDACAKSFRDWDSIVA